METVCHADTVATLFAYAGAQAKFTERGEPGTCTTFCWEPGGRLATYVPAKQQASPGRLDKRENYQRLASPHISAVVEMSLLSSSTAAFGPDLASGIWVRESISQEEPLQAELPMITWSGQLPVSPRRPQVETDRSAAPLLSDREREALSLLVPFLEREARKSFVPIERIEVRQWVDPEEAGSSVVVREWVDLPADEALEYWDRVGASFDDWVDRQPPRMREIIRKRIDLEIFWRVDV